MKWSTLAYIVLDKTHKAKLARPDEIERQVRDLPKHEEGSDWEKAKDEAINALKAPP